MNINRPTTCITASYDLDTHKLTGYIVYIIDRVHIDHKVVWSSDVIKRSQDAYWLLDKVIEAIYREDWE